MQVLRRRCVSVSVIARERPVADRGVFARCDSHLEPAATHPKYYLQTNNVAFDIS